MPSVVLRRHRRHQLLTRLAALEASQLGEYVNLFRAEYVAFRPEPEQVASWWDLDGLEQMYEEFVARYGPVLARWRRRCETVDSSVWRRG